MKHKSIQNSLFNVRLAERQDFIYLADILTASFYGEFSFLAQLFQPLIRWSIMLDLSSRLSDDSSNQACLVATRTDWQQTPSDRIIATVEMNLRHIPQRSPNAFPNIFLFNWSTSQYPYLSNLAVHPQSRRQGAAAQLMKSAEQMALRWGFEHIYLHVMENNQPARQLYQSLGYQLYKVDADLGFWFFKNPRRFLLRKLLKS